MIRPRPLAFTLIVLLTFVGLIVFERADYEMFAFFFVVPIGGVLFLLYAPQYARASMPHNDSAFGVTTWGVVYTVLSCVPPCNFTLGALPALITTLVLIPAVRRKYVLLAPVLALVLAWLSLSAVVWLVSGFKGGEPSLAQLFVPVAVWNALMYTALEWDLRTPLLREQRQMDGQCLECGYDLVGLDPSAPCPECGATRPALPGAPG